MVTWNSWAFNFELSYSHLFQQNNTDLTSQWRHCDVILVVMFCQQSLKLFINFYFQKFIENWNRMLPDRAAGSARFSSVTRYDALWGELRLAPPSVNSGLTSTFHGSWRALKAVDSVSYNELTIKLPAYGLLRAKVYSTFHPSGVGKWVPAIAWKANANAFKQIDTVTFLAVW